MLRGGIPIGKAFGISLRLNYSWFIVLVLMTWVLSTSYFPSQYPEWSLSTRIAAGVITSFLFFGNWFNGLWLAFIGWFLENAAVGSYRQLALRGMLQGHKVSEVITRECQTLSPGLTIEQLVNEHILTSGRRCFPVATDGRVMGLVTLHNIKAILRDQWHMKMVEDRNIAGMIARDNLLSFVSVRGELGM